MQAHRGVLIVVFGVLSIVTCGIFGIAAWVMGNADLAKMAAGQMDPAGESNTRTGKILGIIGVALMILWTVGIILAMVLLGGAVALESY